MYNQTDSEFQYKFVKLVIKEGGCVVVRAANITEDIETATK